MAMGPLNALHTPGWVEITLPYNENRNEQEVALDPRYFGPMPCWDMWDWLENTVPDMHDEENGGVAWWRTSKYFQFFFRDKRAAALFHTRFGGEVSL
jgi:hypothetical protein